MNPFLFLAAAPTAPASIPTLTRREGVRQLIESPPVTRHDGWNLVTLDQARLVAGERLTLANGTRKHLDLYADGTFIAFGAFSNFLGWRGDGAGFAVRPKINSLALAEYVYDFVGVYDAILAFVEPRPPTLRFALGIRHAHFDEDKRLYLLPGPINGLAYTAADEDDRAYAPATTFEHGFDADVAAESELGRGSIALDLVRPLYNWFGLTDDQVPYTNAERTEIDGAAIENPRG